MKKIKKNDAELNVQKIQLRLPYELRSHKNFGNVEIMVDEDQIHFHLTDPETKLPEIWIYDGERLSWTNVEFLMDSTSTQI